MTSFSTIGPNDFDEILSNYNIDQIDSFKILEGGSENTNLLLEGKTKKYVLTICEQKSDREAKILGDLLQYLEKKGFNTSKVIVSSNEETTASWKGKPIIIKEYLEGYIDEKPSKTIIKKIVNSLCQLHQIDSPDYIPKQFSYGIQCFDEMKTLAPESDFCKWLLFKKQYIQKHLNTSLPKCLIHGDIYYSNVIVNEENDSISIMDFEEACYYYRVFDIGMLIIGTCCDGLIPNQSKFQTLVATYHQKNQLTTLEVQSIKAFTVYAACATAFWRYRKFNHLNPVPKLYNHYKDLQKLVESLMIIPNSIFVKF